MRRLRVVGVYYKRTLGCKCLFDGRLGEAAKMAGLMGRVRIAPLLRLCIIPLPKNTYVIEDETQFPYPSPPSHNPEPRAVR